MEENKELLHFIETGELPKYLPPLPQRTAENLRHRQFDRMHLAWIRIRGIMVGNGLIKWENGLY